MPAGFRERARYCRWYLGLQVCPADEVPLSRPAVPWPEEQDPGWNIFDAPAQVCPAMWSTSGALEQERVGELLERYGLVAGYAPHMCHPRLDVLTCHLVRARV